MKILVVDDERAVRESLRRALELEGYEIELADDGLAALAALERRRAGRDDPRRPHARTRRAGGRRRVRREGSRLPMLMLTARVEVDDRVAGLDAGADDYVTKPFALDELLARVRALLRADAGDGTGDARASPTSSSIRARARCTRDGEPIELTRTEFSLLELFMRNPRQVLTRSVIFERVWGYDFGFGSNSLDVYIGYLRRKTEAGGKPRLIQTVRGVGYALREP